MLRVDAHNDKDALGVGDDQLPTPALSPIHDSAPRQEHAFHNDDNNTDLPTIKEETGAVAVGDVANPCVPSTPKLASNSTTEETAKILKLSPQQIHDLVTSPESLPIRAVASPLEDVPAIVNGLGSGGLHDHKPPGSIDQSSISDPRRKPPDVLASHPHLVLAPPLASVSTTPGAMTASRPPNSSRSVSSPLLVRKQSTSKVSKPRPELPSIKTTEEEGHQSHQVAKASPGQRMSYSPMPGLLPIPPLSLPTYLQLELTSDPPSELYLHRSAASEVPYESSKAKFERLLNFLLLPPNLEQALWFGTIACLDAWLYTFTILPLRSARALTVLAQWWARSAMNEMRYLSAFVYTGLGRVWLRKRASSVASSGRPSLGAAEGSRRPSEASLASQTSPKVDYQMPPAIETGSKTRKSRHRRTRSVPSALLPAHKADLLQGLLIATSCYCLMWFDASRMYHSIRGQSAIKLYVIYNVLEVFDRLFSALGQDILECLFSKETLERKENGRSKIIRPLWLWLLALVYVVVHSTALFYQVVTLNVAVNSYSNALLTLLMSNQFVEIKGTVFKKFEKENLFQLTCADIVERFQLWLMLLIIALRNIVELGGLGFSLSSVLGSASTPVDSIGVNASAAIPLTASFAIPRAFTLLPRWTGELLGPFLIVLGSEALVDWCKHAYIGKFNNTKPNIYGRFLDVLAKDYYTHAFGDQNLTKRLGLPVIPLSCLFIRACVQTYQMFLATHLPAPLPLMATAVSLDNSASETSSPATTAALQHIDRLFRHALGTRTSTASSSSAWWTIDDFVATGTILTFFLAIYLLLLAFKILLGMLLLVYARKRYQGMKEREIANTQVVGGKRGGVGAMTEVDEGKREWIYVDDREALEGLRAKEGRGRKVSRDLGGGHRLEGVDRYSMVAKRIW
ncbi:hypothetical protein LTR62_006351 [Meristemomyces frigidus]|uniref:DUF747-domain-containing protein n=1 Tax=Meristemomyces frigidus TaxID=1508187 RepID=A0AAN7TG98_9PEZI|nr:hypothetical protein LTR62_006351 [Meristemomyces frigidus]